jgi:hypothetical protein
VSVTIQQPSGGTAVGRKLLIGLAVGLSVAYPLALGLSLVLPWTTTDATGMGTAPGSVDSLVSPLFRGVRLLDLRAT